MYDTAQHYVDEFKTFYYDNLKPTFKYFRLLNGKVVKCVSTFGFDLYEDDNLIELELSYKHHTVSKKFSYYELDTLATNPLFWEYQKMKNLMKDIVINNTNDFYKEVYEDD